VDEDYVTTPTSCGQGVCSSSGQLECQSGTEVDTCTPGPQNEPTDVTCDGLDGDCDGSIDEDYVITPTTCGVGECAGNTGQLECQSGAEVDTCDPLAGATPEGPDGDPTCTDTLDNDCDGTTDATDADCACVPTGLPDNNCDGIDDDCDGTPDDEYVTTPTSCGQGVCAASGTLECQSGTEVDTCTPGTQNEATDVTCDGLDGDCDGSIDEDYVITTTSCGVGECATTGTLECQSGTEVDTCTPLPAGTEGPPGDATCSDTLDNDCDGATDITDADCGTCLDFDIDIQPIFDADCVGCHSGSKPKGQQDLTAGVSYDNLVNGGRVEPGDRDNSILYQKLFVGNMNNKTTAENKELIASWIDQGANPGGPGTDADGDCAYDNASGGFDCNDSDSAIRPGALEQPVGDPICNDGIDNDCDGAADAFDTGCGGPGACELDYANDIQAIFDTNCISCHSGGNPKGGLDLSAGVSYNNLVPSRVEPGDRDNSLIYQKLFAGSMNNKTAEANKERIGIWIDQGANPAGPGTDADGDCAFATSSGGFDCDDTDLFFRPGADDSDCNNFDEDCDGTPDDDYVTTPTTCGVGECAASGQLECQSGTEVDTCTPLPPEVEGPVGDPTCIDTLDNDCDGTIDAGDPDCTSA
jgi:hypothetical protein